jgi:type 1 fimbriae regulatory protein FimB/type 1 fimbriae regulatory protein FimE
MEVSGKKNRRNVKSNEIPVDLHEKEKDFITEAELEELVKAAGKSRHRWRDTALLRVMFWHGLRVSELCNLRQSDLDFRSGKIHVRRIKGGLSTHHPMRGDELRALKRYLKERTDSSLPWVFITERGEQFTRYGINYLLRAISARSVLSFHVHPHMLRHGCGYALANRGRDTRLIQDYLGHRDIKHTARYTRTASLRFEKVWD